MLLVSTMLSVVYMPTCITFHPTSLRRLSAIFSSSLLLYRRNGITFSNLARGSLSIMQAPSR